MATATSTPTPSEPENEPRDRYTLLSDLEGAIAVSRGLSEAIAELSSMKKNPERRLSGINAIIGGLEDQLADARAATMELYDFYFADKKGAGE